MAVTVRRATNADISRIVELVNQAFAVEHSFKDGDRTDHVDIAEHLLTGAFLLAEEEKNLLGCVYVQVNGERGYIGLLSVLPNCQKLGIGARLMDDAETHCRQAGCAFADLRIVHLRTDLLPYYGKRGYTPTGSEPASVITNARVPLQFLLMSKSLKEPRTK